MTPAKAGEEVRRKPDTSYVVSAFRRTSGIVVLIALAAGCTASPPSGASNESAKSEEWFTDRAREAGLDFVHFNGASGELYMPEILGPGCALLDYDNDGDLDVFLPQGQMLGRGKTIANALHPPPAAMRTGSRLFRNDLEVRADGTRTIHFTDVTDQSHIDVRGYPMGAAAADFDNDGCVDLYVTSFDRNQLFRNTCRGAFTDVSKQSGLDAPGWSVSASFADYDRDGWLDLYVGNYVRYPLESRPECHAASGEPDYCTPQAFRAQPDRLYHNQRNGTFADVTTTALTGGKFGPALGVMAADFNADGWPDFYVANDGEANQLWVNQRNGTFKDAALLAGAALSAEGKPEGSMGIDAADFDNDGDDDLIVTNLPDQGSDLYLNNGSGMFEDSSTRSGIKPASLGLTGFGTAWIDYDNDGWLDLLAVNGAVSLKPSRANREFPYYERNSLFHNLRNGRFEDAGSRAGAVFELLGMGRGACFGDIDNDGDTDVLVTNNNGPVRLLINNVGNRQHWLGLKLIGDRTARDMIGARVVVNPGRASAAPTPGAVISRRARADGSYASANDPRVLIGLGESSSPVRLRVLWPTGESEEWTDISVDRWMTLKQGTGK